MVRLARLFGDCADLLFINEKVWLAVARQANHAIVEILDPALHDFAVVQLDHDLHLALTQTAQIQRFLAGFSRRGRLL